MSTLQELKQQLEEAEDGLNTCHQALALDPKDAEALEMLPMCQEQVNDLKAQISALKAQQSSAAPPPPPSADAAPATAKYDVSKHPKFRGDTPSTPTEEARAVFKVGDSVQAKYSADKQWYPATIVSQTGSPSDPVYTVKFVGYPDKEQKRKYEVRAVESKKRKAESNPPPPPAPLSAVPPPPPPMSPDPISHGTVISAAASIDPNLVPKREPSKVSDGPTRMAPAPKKLKGNRLLEKSKSSWNDWQKTGPKKPAVGGTTKLKKDSQFRTPDLPNAKVGFTGSGKPMTKDQTRAKWNYGQTRDDD